MVIRPAKPEEAHLLSALALRSKAYWGYSAEFMRLCKDELNWSADQIAASAFTFVVAERHHQIVGFYAVELISDKEFELEALFVEPSHIGTGVGRTLIEHAKSTVVGLGGHILLIQGDPHAEQFYLAAGGQLVGYRASQSVPGRQLPLFKIVLLD
ncbi:GNAT family N-acetyltransferase [Saccharospirillum salsuginis]|uniref:N-acetyltransferase n=1 Tax=Saccharospirillum salsuginis TaxID=418750 RepID=A0A918KTI6_9GAMM|nr:GNAT family N-acetyltransferase [Saccharospirillum salsuginis]GGX73773.1 N-acetyltransferase [Saccharospirillum salsuginis]